MADVDGDGRYDVQEFAIAAHLAYRYTCGASVPVRLPLHLVPVTKRFIDPFERSEITLEESKSRNLAVSQKRVDSSHPQELHLLSSGPLTAASSKCRKFRLHSASGEGGVGVLIAFPSSSADAGVACQARDRKKQQQQQLVMRPSSSNKLLVEFSSAGGINIRYQNRKRVKRVTVSASRPGVSPTASGTLEDTQTKLITVSRATLQDSEVQQQRE
ncbi:unnamed protein product [Notodromas monacha]|uniref:EF-hand domain-containing protein n=1 Tax=Notodromas monacha TaxID=399045 RepID=A0A7R9GK92_9CRUS|nr:unnamed protein product [Notodromas monacha]CAG0924507.1 unnamed protein product [Notodromas monacha]